ncbi:MAG TPA: GNAT family N-acetyltransferase [Symbiobacteriaceae bacterium]|nr:GNAT family N-acetyltransferase [Symbiobacteriaceae bacterium]
MELTFRPVTAELWDDFEKLFGKNGACGGCWCMSWRQSRKEYALFHGEANKLAMKQIVESGEVPGLLAYDGTEPVAWCSVAPRSTFPRLEASRWVKLVDKRPVWSVVCFFVAKKYRKQGMTVALLNASADYVRQQGGEVLEGYPAVPSGEQPPAFLWNGIYNAFLKAGFAEVARSAPTRAIVRRILA